MSALKSNQNRTVLSEIEKELNKFFKDSKCTEVIYTKNTDKMFFGMRTYAILSDSDVNRILTDDNPIRIERYYIEIDSKLLEIGLTSRELTAILLHEVGHLVNDSSPSEQVKKAIDLYMADNGIELNLKNAYETNKFLAYAIKDSIRKITSMFTRNDDEILADEFVFMCGFGGELESAFKKITRSSKVLKGSNDNKLLGLAYSLKIYKDIGIHRSRAIKTLNKMKSLTGSKIEQREMDEAITALKRVNISESRVCIEKYNSIVVENCTLLESEDMGLVEKMRRKGLKGIEEDLYEFHLRSKNVETEEEAMLLLRQINTRMSVLDDYLTYSAPENPREKDRWEKVYLKYYELRDNLMKKTIWNKKQYGIWFDYQQL